MKRYLSALSLVAFSLLSNSVYAAPPLVNPVTVPLGGAAVHLTPHGYDSTGNEISLVGASCTVIGLPATLATVAYDSTGALLTAVATGTSVIVQYKCVNSGTTVMSAPFTVTVPWVVTSIGTTSP